MPTPNLGLPLITRNMTADVVRDMNALAQAVDSKVASKEALQETNETVATKIDEEALQLKYEKAIQTYSVQSRFLLTLEPGQVFIIDPLLDDYGYKNFEVVLQGHTLANKHIGVRITGNSDLVMCTGSIAVFPSSDVTTRYTSSSAWHRPGVTKTTYDITKALVGFSYDTIPSAYGCGVFENTFYSCLVDPPDPHAHDIQLLGISIEGNRIQFIFRNSNSSIPVRLSTSVAIKVSK